ncbi:hypothetical protein EVAR_38617_1 [Eumeta japonica]|uniref:Uncharacterized protein n=1 Tax=Eumeta variegata TaxID=151549 RepID=A0A4C1WRQ1_EUMVA|nr:hypothetical protein EVAR_38617_1 [Eumeta japonica]
MTTAASGAQSSQSQLVLEAPAPPTEVERTWEGSDQRRIRSLLRNFPALVSVPVKRTSTNTIELARAGPPAPAAAAPRRRKWARAHKHFDAANVTHAFPPRPNNGRMLLPSAQCAALARPALHHSPDRGAVECVPSLRTCDGREVSIKESNDKWVNPEGRIDVLGQSFSGAVAVAESINIVVCQTPDLSIKLNDEIFLNEASKVVLSGTAFGRRQPRREFDGSREIGFQFITVYDLESTIACFVTPRAREAVDMDFYYRIGDNAPPRHNGPAWSA